MVPYELWDGRTCFARIAAGLPTWRWQCAPVGLATRRQLRAEGLSLNGQEPYGQIVWKRGKRVAYLYRIDLAKPKRVASAAQLVALEKALDARRYCRDCGRYIGSCVPRGCIECVERAQTGGIADAA